MSTKENARLPAGAKRISSAAIISKTRAFIKSAIVTAILWRLVPLSYGERLIRALRLRGDA